MVTDGVNLDLLETEVFEGEVCIDHVLNVIPVPVLESYIAQDLESREPVL